MEFEIQYTQEQEEFRQEVRAWLADHAKMPPELGAWPRFEVDVTKEQWDWKMSVRREVGHKGWLFPTMPKEYGGGGLSPDHEMVLSEELARYDMPLERMTAVAGM